MDSPLSNSVSRASTLKKKSVANACLPSHRDHPGNWQAWTAFVHFNNSEQSVIVPLTCFFAVAFLAESSAFFLHLAICCSADLSSRSRMFLASLTFSSRSLTRAEAFFCVSLQVCSLVLHSSEKEDQRKENFAFALFYSHAVRIIALGVPQPKLVWYH